jgi:diguanylate cyclase (GGDEF)-like protein
MDQYHLFVTLVPFALIFSISILIYARRQQSMPLAKKLFVMMIPVCGYLITNTLELVDPTEAGTLFWAKAGYLFAPTFGVVWLGFALEYIGRRNWFSKKSSWAIWIVPILTNIFVQTNDLHHLIWTQTVFTQRGSFLSLSVSYGPWFWVNAIYSYILLIIGAVLVAREYFYSFHTFRRQTMWMIIGMIVPLVNHIIYVGHLVPGWQKDYSPIGFAISGIAFAIGIFRFQLFSLAPIARSLVMDYIEDGICVVDASGQVVDANPALQRILKMPAVRLIGQRASEVLPFWNKIGASATGEMFGTVVEIGERFFELRSNEISRNAARQVGKPLGRLWMLSDITERRLLMAEVEQLAITDPLTGLYNRRYFTERVQEEMERSRRLNHPLTVMMLDLDHFKRINDTYGHATGDEILILTAAVLEKSLRKIDFAARYGGEEFLVLLPETDLEESLVIGERLRIKVAEEPFETSVGRIRITLSIGVASFTGNANLSVEELISWADHEMYAAKHEGRNRVCSLVVI